MLRRAQIASAPHPQGLIWIMNILLELDIYCTFTTHGHWADPFSGEVHPDHFFLSHQGTCLFPAMKAFQGQAHYRPGSGLGVECGHILPTSVHLGHPTLVWYRDIQGALYSQWKRNHEADPSLSLEVFLNSELLINGQSTGLGLSPQDYWALYYFLWMHSLGTWSAFQFDDLKREPILGVRSLLSFLGEARTDEQIRLAVESSAVDKILRDHPSEAKGFFRAGDTAEGQRCFPNICLPMIGPLPGLVREFFQGTWTQRVDEIPWAGLLEMATERGLTAVPGTLLHYLEEQDFATAHAVCMTAEPENDTAQLVLLALRWALQTSNSPLSLHLQYTDPGLESTIKVILFVLASAAVPSLVQQVAEREFRRHPSLFQSLEQLESEVESLRTQTAQLRARLIQVTRARDVSEAATRDTPS